MTAGIVEQAVAHAEQHKAARGARKGERPAYVSGHCNTARMVTEGLVNSNQEGRQWHQGCRGTVVNGNGAILTCTCRCHENHTVCRLCGRIDVEIGTEGAAQGICLDMDGCDSYRAAESAANPVHQMIERCISDSQRKAAAKRLGIEAPEGGSRPTESKRKAKTTNPGGLCHCGCGGSTGGRFVVGHDMKLKSRLVADLTSLDEGVPVMAAAELLARGWKLDKISAELKAAAEAAYGVDREADTIAHFAGKRQSGG